MKNSNILKRVLAVIVAVIVACSSTLTAWAATSASDWNGHHRFKVDGNDAYCVNFGKEGGNSGKIDGSAWKYWNGLSVTTRNKVELAVTAAHVLGYYNGTAEQYFGVQYYIWLQTNPDKAKEKLSDWFKSTVDAEYKKVKSKVDELEKIRKCRLSGKTTTEFKGFLSTTQSADESLYKGYWEEASWTADNISKKTVTSDGKVKKTFAVVDSSKPGEATLKIKSKDNLWYTNAKKENLYKFGVQEVLYLNTATNDTYTRKFFYNKPTPKSGRIQVTKTLQYGGAVVAQPNIQFDVYDDDGTHVGSMITDVNGTANSDVFAPEGLEEGKYYVSEVLPDGYLSVDGNTTHEVIVTANATAEVKSDGHGNVVNIKKLGDFRINKHLSDIDAFGYLTGGYGTPGVGYNIRLFGTSMFGDIIDIHATTAADGFAYFCNVPLGHYTVTETYSGDKFLNTNVSPNTTFSVEIDIVWDGQYGYPSYCTTDPADYNYVTEYYGDGVLAYANNYDFYNTLKTLKAGIQKVDADTGEAVPQGDASLEGAKYELHREYGGTDTVLGTYTTDAKGEFEVGPVSVLGDYYLMEIDASTGYKVNDKKQYVYTESMDTSSWGLNTVLSEKFKTPETVKKAPIAIQKYANIEGAPVEDRVAEEKAEFEVYLKSAGSYKNAKKSERDYLVTDKKGYAKSKDLPYGTYIIHQVKSSSKFIALAKDIEVFVNEDKSVTPVYKKEITNTILTYEIHGFKYNRETNAALQGVVFGLFKGDETEFTEEKAIKTVVSDEKGEFVFDKLTYDTEWVVKELQQAKGYLTNEEIYRFQPDITEKVVELKVANDMIPELQTTATVDGEKEICATEVFTLTDTVAYQHLVPGKEYVVKGVLMDKSTGKEFLVNGETVTSETTFTPEAPSGTVDVLFTFDSKFIKTETDIVVFENLYKDGKELAVHADINDKEQTVTVKIPEIKTTAKANGKKEVKAKGKITITDTVKYTNLTVGKEYVVKGVLMDKATGKPFTVKGKEITAEVMFTPQKTNGKVKVPFTFDGSGITAETEVVVFETLYREGIEIATHTDLKDKNQTVKIIIPQTPKTPKTGDESNRRKLATVFGASLFGMLYLAHTFLRKRKKEKETNNEC